MVDGAPGAEAKRNYANRRVRNLYHMLLYIWGHHRRNEFTPAPANADKEESPESLAELFARVLVEAVARQLRHGLYREYVLAEESGPRIRGQIQFADSVGRMLFQQGMAHCAFDDFSSDTLHNRILRTTLLRLLREGELNPELAGKIRALLPRMGDVSEIELCRRHFSEAKLHRNNREYGLLIDVCRFIHEEAVPDRSRAGGMRFRAFADDWFRRKGAIFQHFIKCFYRRRASNLCLVRDTNVNFDHAIVAARHDGKSEAYLAGLQTDVLLDFPPRRRLVIECKFYAKPFEANASRFADGEPEEHDESDSSPPPITADRRKLSNAHILQLGAYMDAITRKEPGSAVEGLLLYVQPDGEPLAADYTRTGVGGLKQPFSVRCVNLTKPWVEIEADLLSFLEPR